MRLAMRADPARPRGGLALAEQSAGEPRGGGAAAGVVGAVQDDGGIEPPAAGELDEGRQRVGGAHSAAGRRSASTARTALSVASREEDESITRKRPGSAAASSRKPARTRS